MGGLIEAVLAGSLVGIFTLLGVWLAGWQERKRAREAHEARKKEMVYAKQLEVVEETIKWLTFLTIERLGSGAVVEKLLANKLSKEQEAVLLEEEGVIAQEIDGLIEESREIMAKISTYLPLEAVDTFREYLEQSTASGREVEERLRRREGGGFEGTKERLNVVFQDTVLKMREHLDIRERIGAGEATRIGGRRRLKLKFWASGRSGDPLSRPKS